MPAPKKAEEKPPPKAEDPAAPVEEKDEPKDPPAPPSPRRAREAKNSPKAPKLPALRPREWFDFILPNAKGEGFFGGFSRALKPKE